MPVEFTLLKDKEQELKICPKCKKNIEYFMRGEVQSSLRKFFKLKYCAIICRSCKQIVGYEKP